MLGAVDRTCDVGQGAQGWRQRLAGGLRWARLAWAGLALGLTDAACLWAQSSSKQEAAPPAKDYFKSYGLVLLLILLGMMVVTRPGRRADTPREMQAEE